MAANISSDNSWLNKWTIALVVGGGVACGAGVYFYSKKSGPTVDEKNSSKAKSKPTQPVGKGDQLMSADDTLYAEAREYKDEGNTHFKSGNYKEAIAYYSKAISICPKERIQDLSTFYQNRAAGHEQLKLHEQVIEDCSKAIELNPRYVKALQRRAKAYEVTKDLEHSLDDLTSACILEQFQNQNVLLSADRVLKELGRKHARESMASRKPTMPSKFFVKSYFSSFAEDPVTSNLAQENENDSAEADLRGYAQAKQYFLQQKYDDIIAACTEEIESKEGSNKPEALLLRATFLLLTGDHDSAMKDFDAVINNIETNVKVRANALIKRASLFMQLEKAEQTIDDFNAAAELDPSNSDVFHHRGQVHLLMDKTAEAMADFEKAVTLNPNFAVAYVQKCYTDYRYAFTTRNVEKLEDVMKSFQEAIKRFPKCCECYTLYAQVLSDRQDYEKADEHFEMAIKVEPDNATIYVHRALLHLQWNGDIVKATNMINQAIKVDDRCEFAYETLGTIEVQRGNLKLAVELFDKAIPLAKTELERSHLFALRGASITQARASERLGIPLENLQPF